VLRVLFTLGILLGSLAPLLAEAAGAAGASARPNIIFIFADDWGFGDLGFRGNPDIQTPNLDRLASEGTDFQQFTVAGSVCSPSRAAVMTGQYPARHSVHRHFASLEHHARSGMPDWLDVTVHLLPRLLQQAGYATGHFGKWHLTNVSAKDAPLPVGEIAGVSLPEGYEPDGESFLPALRGEAWQRGRPLYWECYNGSARGDNWARLAIRDGNWKLLMDPEGKRVELYDIPNDAGESSNLAAEHPERVRELRARIKAWKSTLPTEPPANAISIHR
jgi:arylsulfatase A-like enzyme